MAVDLAEDLHVGPVLGDPRRADEDRRASALRLTPCDIDVRLEASHLASERVALGANVHHAEVVAVEHDQPGA